MFGSSSILTRLLIFSPNNYKSMFLTAICETLPDRQGFLKKPILLLLLLSLISLSIGVRAEKPNLGITLAGENVPLQKVFKKITKMTGYAIFCDYNLLQEAGLVTVNVKNAPLEAALDSCLKDKALSFEIIGKTIVIMRKAAVPVTGAPVPVLPGPPPIDVHGRVVDEKGSPVVAATVEVRGAKKVTTTNDNGEFTLTGIPDNAVLIISSVGFDKVELRVAGQHEVAVTMKINGTLSETVVTALGLVKEARKVGYSVAVVGGDQLDKARETNVALSLDGQVAGLQVRGANGGCVAIPPRGRNERWPPRTRRRASARRSPLCSRSSSASRFP